jgi:subtilisin family serine protease
MLNRFRLIIFALVASSWVLAPAIVRTQPQAGKRGHEHVMGLSVVAGEVLVRLRSTTGASVSRLRRDADADDDQLLGRGEWRRVHSGSRGAAALLAALAANPDVAEAEPNYIVHTTGIPNEPWFSSLWGLLNTAHSGADIHATAAWDISTGSAANVVGVVDTGVDYNHPDLAANMWSAPSAFTITLGGRSLTCPAGSHGFDAIAFANNNLPAACNPMDDHGHGTHTSGTVGAVGNNGFGVVGVNWTTRIMGLRFMDSTGGGTTADAVNAVDFALQVKAAFASTGTANVRVLSNSWGGPGYSGALAQAIDRAAAKNVLFVAAAGNAGSNIDAAPFYPAALPNASIVSVAATNETDALAGFSNYGPSSVDLAAPGNNIVSTTPNGGYGAMSGTSMATPHVAGAAALLLSACSLTTETLRSAILDNVDALPSLTGVVATNGRLNVDKAIRNCAPRVPAPTVTMTSPLDGAIFTAPVSIRLAADATASSSIVRVDFFEGTTKIGSTTLNPYEVTWTTSAIGDYNFSAKVYDANGLVGSSTSVHSIVAAPVGSASAKFLSTDATTRGNWRGVYGGDGFNIINDTVSYPSYASVGASGMGSWTWAASTADPRGLQKAAGSDRLAGTWYGGAFTVDVNIADGATHQLALYLVDWDSTQRIETLEVRDATSKVLLDSRSVAGFNGGQYWRWTISGHVEVRVVGVTGINAVISGVFFDSGAPNAPPTVTMTSPVQGATFAAPGTVGLTADASDADGIDRVEFYQGTQLVGTAATSPYGATWNNVPAGNYTLTAKAVDRRGASMTSAPVSVSVTGPIGGPSAVFLGSDTTTQGNWRGVYGGDGFNIINDTVSYPSYASVGASGMGSWTWAASTADPRGLQKAAGSDRLAGTWYGGAFTVDVNIADGATHQLALYLVDWDSTQRIETLEVRDATSKVLLDSRSVARFNGGQYWRWTISGHVEVRVVGVTGINAVVSGVFFDR